MISLTVTLEVRPGHLDAFLAAIGINAHDTVTDESGSRAFDVVQDVAADHRFVLYEVYEDEEALNAHRSTPHFRRWREAAEQHVVPGSQTNRVGIRIIHESAVPGASSEPAA